MVRTTTLCLLAMWTAAVGAASAGLRPRETVRESARMIPVADSVDVVVVGGSSGGVAAAVSAAEKGATVLLVARRMYLGEDLCATLRLAPDEAGGPADPLAKQLFPGGKAATPLHVKKTLDDALAAAKVRFLFGCYVTDVLRDASGRPAGVVMANRAGRQAVVAKVIVDATERAAVAELAGAKRRPWGGGEIEFERTLILPGGSGKRKGPRAGAGASGSRSVVRRVSLAMKDLSFRSLARAENEVRDRTCEEGQLRSSERVFFVPPDPIICRAAKAGAAKDRAPDQDEAGAPTGDVPDLAAFRPAGVEGLFVLSGCADVPRAEAAKLLAPGALIPWGRRVGQAAAEEAAAKPAPKGTHVPASPAPAGGSAGVPWHGRLARASQDRPGPAGTTAETAPGRMGETPMPHADARAGTAVGHMGETPMLRATAAPAGALAAGALATSGGSAGTASRAGRAGEDAGDVREVLTGLRPVGNGVGHVKSSDRGLGVWGRWDVVVVGGGTSGAAAAIGAARRGASVLVVEVQDGLGGVGTLGMIGKPYHGRKVGFAGEVPFPDRKITIEDKMEWYRREIRTAGGEVWLGVLGCGAYVADGCVRGAVVATPQGRGVALAGVVIDATGNADLAAAAGAATMYGTVELGDVAMQGAGLPTRNLTSRYTNTDYLLVDEADMVDVHRALVGSRRTMSEASYDAGTFVQTRERRRVVGEFVMTYLDQIAGRTYGDAIVHSASDYDSHGYPSIPYFALIPHTPKSLKANHPAPGGSCWTPYRCLLPKGLRGMLVIGLGMSMRRDASAMVRMQLDMANQGYAAGAAAAMAVAGKTPLRTIDVRALQKHLVKIGNLPAKALRLTDSFPLSEAAVRQAVATLAREPDANRQVVSHALAIVLSYGRKAEAPLLEAWGSAKGAIRLRLAKILGTLGRREVVGELIDALDAARAWDPKILQGRMAEYAHLPTPTDAVVLALGYAGDRRATPAVLRKLALLDANVPLSHHRSVALALERLADPAAAAPLAALLAKPKMRGHALTQLAPLPNANRAGRRRLGSLREIVLARALLACGDHQGLARTILHEYTHDVRGLLARHARAVLAGKTK